MRKIIPCLDTKDGKVVKGIQFQDLRDIGSPPELAAKYESQGADEITLLDISATLEGRETKLRLISDVSKMISIPLAVGGGIRSIEEMRAVLDSGADKGSMNSAALMRPELIGECATEFGRKRVIVAIDAKKVGDIWKVYTHGGTVMTDVDAIEWSRRAEELGAGEILLTSIDADGAKTGYDIPLTAAVSEAVSIPVTASGGCGSAEHIYEVFTETKASSALAASLFHYDGSTVIKVKEYLKDRGVRL